MQKIIKTLIIIITIVFIFILALKTPFVKYPATLLFSHALKSDVSMQKCSISLKGDIIASGVDIKNEKGLHCVIGEADIKTDFMRLLRKELYMECSLKKVELTYADSAIIDGIAKLLTIEAEKLLVFDTVDGIIYIKSNETTIKDLNASGKDVSLFANGTTTDDENINYTFKLTLSENITSGIPEAIRMIFFKEQDNYSIVELYLSGDIKKPSINFSTPLFKLRIK